MTGERFELDFTPHPTEEKHELLLGELIANTVRDYHAEHPKLRRRDVQNAIRRVEADFLRESKESDELPSRGSKDFGWLLTVHQHDRGADPAQFDRDDRRVDADSPTLRKEPGAWRLDWNQGSSFRTIP